MTPAVLAIAETQAAQDRDTLARLVREGAVFVSGKRGAGKTELMRDIDDRLHPRRKINLAIRPKRKNGRHS